MKEKKILSSVLTVSLVAGLVAGCGSNNNTTVTTNTEISSETTAEVTSENKTSDSEYFSDRDMDDSYDATEATLISLDDSVTIDGEGAENDDGIITISQEGTYVISGTSEDTQIVVDAGENDKIQLVLNDTTMSYEEAPVYVKEADKVFITLAANTKNTLSLTAEDTENIEADAGIYSTSDITFNGGGSLTINSTNDGISGKDDVKITNGNIVITCSGKGLDANDSVCMTNVILDIAAGKDGIHCENEDDESLGYVYIADGSYIISAEGDGISASGACIVDDGTFDITTGGGYENAEQKTSENFGQMGGGRMNGQGRGDKTMKMNGNSSDTADINSAPEIPTDANGEQMTADMQNMPSNMEQPSDMEMPSGEQPANMEMPSGAEMPSDMEMPSDTNQPADATAPTDGSFYVSGTIDSSSESDSDSIKGIKASGDITINNGTFTINSADDAIHSNSDIYVNAGTFTVDAGDDGIHADGNVEINDGTIGINNSYEGIEGEVITLNNGDITVVSTDDGLNASGGNDQSGFGGRGGDMFGSNSSSSIVINGGTLLVNAAGDGVDSNGTLEINGGDISIYGPTSGDTSIIDFGTTGVINGGTFNGSGANSMLQTFDDSEQAVITKTFETQDAGTLVQLLDGDNVIAEFTPNESFQAVIISNSEIVKGNSYTLNIGNISMAVTAE